MVTPVVWGLLLEEKTGFKAASAFPKKPVVSDQRNSCQCCHDSMQPAVVSLVFEWKNAMGSSASFDLTWSTGKAL